MYITNFPNDAWRNTALEYTITNTSQLCYDTQFILSQQKIPSLIFSCLPYILTPLHILHIFISPCLYILSKIQITSECRKHSFLMADSITKISGWHPISISKLIKIIPSICQFPIIWQPHASLEKNEWAWMA